VPGRCAHERVEELAAALRERNDTRPHLKRPEDGRVPAGAVTGEHGLALKQQDRDSVRAGQVTRDGEACDPTPDDDDVRACHGLTLKSCERSMVRLCARFIVTPRDELSNPRAPS
jgi:hypothetical protein